jgi:hypothetical protein
MPMRSFLRVSFAMLLATAAASACATDGSWSVRVTPFGQVYPALELSQARPGRAPAETEGFGAGSGLVAVSVRALHDAEQVRLEVDAPGLQAPGVVEATLPTSGRSYVLRPPLAWSAPQLRSLATPLDAKLRVTLVRDGAVGEVRAIPVILRPLSDALYFVRDGADTVDLSWIFAAYVDERDPAVDRVLEAAQQSGIVDAFDGYRGGRDSVYRQVWAVWQALAARGIRYSAADPGIERGPRVFSQRVQLPVQTWGTRSASCIDGSVLIASVLQRIGLRSFLVLVPGHAFVGFHPDAGAGEAAYLETTLLGAPPPRLAGLPPFAAGFDPGAAQRLDIAGFAAALEAGRRRYARAAPRFDRSHRPDYVLIDIGEARAFGIAPIEAAAQPVAGAAGAVSSP